MKPTTRILKRAMAPLFLLLCLPTIAQASSVNIVGNNTAFTDMQIKGVWGSTEKVTFTTSGTYSLLVSDLGLSSAQSAASGSSFSYLGATLISADGMVASATFNKSLSERDRFTSFNIAAGDYFLNLFAVTDSNDNVGTFNMSLLEGDISPVPLPAGFWFMATALLGLFSVFRQSKAAKNATASA